MTSVKSVLCVRLSSLFLFVLVISSIVTRAIVHVFLHAKLRLSFSFFVLVNFYSLIVCHVCTLCTIFIINITQQQNIGALTIVRSGGLIILLIRPWSVF